MNSVANYLNFLTMSLYGIFNNMTKTLTSIFSMQKFLKVPRNQLLEWDIQQFLWARQHHSIRYAVMVLNRPLTQNPDFLTNFWHNATVRVTVDGGTRQWDLLLKKLPEGVSNTLQPPDLITGDFDSITEDVFLKYEQKGCPILHTPNQNFTDFTKAVVALHFYCKHAGIQCDHIIAIGQSSGRIDQIFGNIQTLYLVTEQKLFQHNMKLYLLTDDSISWLLRPGEHVITIPQETLAHKRSWCSLVPVGEPCASVTTTGLKWNLTNMPLRFGELVSTSNTFATEQTVYIKCSHTILWSMRLPAIEKNGFLAGTFYWNKSKGSLCPSCHSYLKIG